MKVFLSSEEKTRLTLIRWCESRDGHQFQSKRWRFCPHFDHHCLLKSTSKVFVCVGSVFRVDPCLKWLLSSPICVSALNSSSRQRWCHLSRWAPVDGQRCRRFRETWIGPTQMSLRLRLASVCFCGAELERKKRLWSWNQSCVLFVGAFGS